jgi:HEAT repeat protein
MSTEEDIKRSLLELEDSNLKVRDAARLHLANVGSAAVPDLIHQLKTDKEPCRREAAKILGEIQEQSAVNDLVEAMLDESIGVGWAASEALIKYGPSAIVPLLDGITRHFSSERFRRGAFHVLHELDQSYHLGPRVREVLHSLHGLEPAASVAWAAERAVEYLKFGK